LTYSEDRCSSAVQGLNTKKGFDVRIAAEISKITGLKFQTAPNKVRHFTVCA
jgi:fumarate hydratase class II